MIRPFRLVATLAVVAALALGVAVRFVRAETTVPPQPVGPPAAALVAAPAPAPAAATAGSPPAELLAYKGAPAPGRAKGEEDYRLDKMPLMSNVIQSVYREYVDPSRIDPKAMVVASLDAVERTVAEVMVHGEATSEKLSVTVGPAQRDFVLKDVDSIWKARLLLGEVLGFVQEHLVAHEDLLEIEYAAANGLLGTLDPHSTLFQPKYFKELELQMVGEFGGLGFVIAMREGNLTVVKVLKGTPAQRAGIKAKDVISKIEEQSTVNMDLQDAVDRLRGKPRTPVTITVQRAAWPEPRRLSLVRETISVEAVPQAKLLDGNVGYVRLSQFSKNCTRDVAQAIAAQRAQAGGQLKGLILDLRGNPGGLLEEAVGLSDLFISEGVIVKTVGEGAQRIREVQEADADRDDLTALPLVVLINNSSASASEIVAGALKNNGRALVVGRQSFGKGSVQTISRFKEPGSAGGLAGLKLTIAQYLTPGDVSIQEVGITPDVALQPGRALKDQVNVFAPPRSMGEADLDRHLSNPTGKDKDAADARKRKVAPRPPLELRYLLDEKEDAVARQLKRDAARETAPHDLSAEQLEDEEIDADPDQVKEDYQIRFARELLGRAPFNDRARLLEAAGSLVTERRAEEARRLEARLGQLGLDWSAGQDKGGTPRAVVTVSPVPGRAQKAGEPMPWTVTVENRGDAPFRRLRAWSTSEKNPLLDRREFVFGAVRPGERRSWTVPVKLPRTLDSRRDEVTLHFDDEAGKAPDDVATSVDVVESPGPLFSFSVQVDDRKGGNGDGLPQRGETFTLRVDVKNGGAGASGEKTFVSIANLGDEKLFMKKGREVVGALKPGESKAAAMEIELRRGSKSEALPLRVQIYDDKTGEFLTEKISLPISTAEAPVTAEGGAVRVEAAEVLVRGGAGAEAPVVAVARKGAVLPTTGAVAGWRRVEWAKGRFGFVAPGEAVAARGARSGVVAEAWQKEAPRIALSPDPSKGGPVVDTATFKLSGSAGVPASADPDTRLRDVFIFVNDTKVFFRVVPEGAAASRLEFTADLPLKPGQNTVTVVARENQEFQSRRSLVIYRRPPAEVAETAAARPAKGTP